MVEGMLARLMVHLVHTCEGDAARARLTAAQWAALRYFAIANRFSRGPSAFAEFHGTTKGTATQTIKALSAKGLLAWQPAPHDGRAKRVELTESGRALLPSDPLAALARAASQLPLNMRAVLGTALMRMVGHVSRERNRCNFGSCGSCAHLQELSGRGQRVTYHCAWMREPLSKTDLELLCLNFTPQQQAVPRVETTESPGAIGRSSRSGKRAI